MISIIDGFSVTSALPADLKTIISTSSSLTSISSSWRYNGMLVYTQAEGQEWRLVGGVSDSNWKLISTSGSSASSSYSNTSSVSFNSTTSSYSYSSSYLIGYSNITISQSISSSFASQSLSSSYANTASYLIGYTTPFLVSSSISSSFASQSLSSSYLIGYVTPTFVSSSISSSFASSSITASYLIGYVPPFLVSSSISASFASGSITSSYSLTASYALNAGSGTTLITGSTYPITSSWANNAGTASILLGSIISSSYSLTSSYALNAGGGGTILITGSTYPITSSWALTSSITTNAITSSYSLTSNSSSYSSHALSSSYAGTAVFGDEVLYITLPGSGSSVDIGNFVSNSKGHNLIITINPIDNLWWVGAKTYILTGVYNNGWAGSDFQLVAPISATGPYEITYNSGLSYAFSDFELEAYMDIYSKLFIRIRVTEAYVPNRTVAVRITNIGDPTDAFTQTTGSATGSTDTTYWPTATIEQNANNGTIVHSNLNVTGNVTSNFTGSLFGTSSYSLYSNNVSASYLSGSNAIVTTANISQLSASVGYFAGGQATIDSTGSLNLFNGAITMNHFFNNTAFNLYGIPATDQGSQINLYGNNANNQWQLQGGGAGSGATGFTIYKWIGGNILTGSIPFRIFDNGNVRIGAMSQSAGFPGPNAMDDGNSVQIVGSLSILSGSITSSIISASSIISHFTGSLSGTSSYAVTSSYFSGSISNSNTSITSSYSTTASYALNGGTGGILTTGSTYPITSSWSTNSITASYFSGSISNATTANTASYVSSSNVIGTVLSSSYAVTASYALTSSLLTGNILNSQLPSQINVYGITASYIDIINNILLGGTIANATNLPNTSIVIGAGTGNNATNANQSNFLGTNAAYNATNANNSNFFGQSAGQSAVNANNSTFIGGFAGSGATNSSQSVFIGPIAGANANNAGLSTFIGQSAGYYSTNANNSIFIGFNAGSSIGTSTSNANNAIFIGNYAGLNDTVNNSAGHSSILIGDYTSTGGNQDSIAIGKGTKNSINNQVNIGNSLFINGIYSGSSSVSTPQLNVKMGIGLNNPVNTLDVIGNISASVITASLFLGTASYAGTASILLGSVVSSSYSSFALTASYALNGGSGSSGTSLVTGSTYPITSSWAISASWAPINGSSSYSQTSDFAVIAGNCLYTSSYALTASYALNGGGSGSVGPSTPDIIQIQVFM